MSVKINSEEKEKIIEAYDDVRNDKSDTNWLACQVNGKAISLGKTGVDYGELMDEFQDDIRVFAFVRVTMGDELSKRAKFALLVWTGPECKAMEKASMGAARTEIKTVILSFAKEISADTKEELREATVMEELRKVGGANYGTGVRD